MVAEDLRPSQILTRQAFANAIRINGAIGGSTNAVVHLLAIAGRIGTELTLDDWDRFGRDVPTILNLMPSGAHLMEDFCYAGGLPVVMKQIADILDLTCMTVTGKGVGANIETAENYNPDVILPRGKALTQQGGIAVLRGNRAPQGAILKPSAATANLMQHRGRAVVFETIDHDKSLVDDPELDIDETCIRAITNFTPLTLIPGNPRCEETMETSRFEFSSVRLVPRQSQGRAPSWPTFASAPRKVLFVQRIQPAPFSRSPAASKKRRSSASQRKWRISPASTGTEDRYSAVTACPSSS